jgi:hypothetical protein
MLIQSENKTPAPCGTGVACERRLKNQETFARLRQRMKAAAPRAVCVALRGPSSIWIQEK